MKTKDKKTAASVSGLHPIQPAAGVAGAVGGAAMGVLAGPPGIAAGAIIGGAVGVLAAMAYEASSAEEAAAERQLDAELGISEGDIGAPNLEHPPAKIGAYSLAASGAGASTDTEPAEGPVPSSDEQT
jgi:hypothetical protein